MLIRLAKCVREYKTPAVMTLLFIIGEAVIEALIPFTTANLVNEIKAGVEMNEVLRLGAILVVMALISLTCGGMAGFTSARAASGFGHAHDHGHQQCSDGVHDDDSHCRALSADAHFLRHYGLPHGRRAGHEFCGHHPRAGLWAFHGRKESHAGIPGSLYQI